METMIINQQNKVEYTRELQQVINRVIKAAARLTKLPENRK